MKNELRKFNKTRKDRGYTQERVFVRHIWQPNNKRIQDLNFEFKIPVWFIIALIIFILTLIFNY